MYLLIEVEDQKDIGNNEKSRYLVDGDRFEMINVLESIGLVDINCRCVKVHPATPQR
jgi:hypothetical protein